MREVRTKEGDDLRLESSDRVVRAWYGRPGYEWKNTNGNIVTLRVLNLPVQSESIRVCNSVLCCDPAPWYRKVLVVDVVPKTHPSGSEEVVAISSQPVFAQQKLNAEFFEDAQDYYMLFGFVRFSDLSKEEVDAAFRACHKKYRCHPNWRQNNIESLSDEEKQFLMSQCLAIAKAHEVLSDPTKKKEYDKQLKEALGRRGQPSWREKKIQGLLCAGMLIGGVVMVSIGFTIGGWALLSAGLRSSTRHWRCANPELSWKTFGLDVAVGALQGTAGSLIGGFLFNSLITPALEAGQVFVAGGGLFVDAVCTKVATETISDLGNVVETKLTTKHIGDAMAIGAEFAAEVMKTYAEMSTAGHWSISSTAGATFRPHLRPSLTKGTKHTRHAHEKHMCNPEVVEQRDLREEL